MKRNRSFDSLLAAVTVVLSVLCAAAIVAALHVPAGAAAVVS